MRNQKLRGPLASTRGARAGAALACSVLSGDIILVFIPVLRIRLDHYLPGDAKAINDDSVSLGKKCLPQRDLDLTPIAKSRKNPFGFVWSFNPESKRETCKCFIGLRSIATAV